MKTRPSLIPCLLALIPLLLFSSCSFRAKPRDVQKGMADAIRARAGVVAGPDGTLMSAGAAPRNESPAAKFYD